MKKRTKKALSISGAIFGVGAIATSITLPIVLSVHSRDSLDENKIFFYDNDGNVGKVPDKDGNLVIATIKNVLEWLKRMGQEDRTQLSRFDYYSSFFIYKDEQEKSLNLQKMWFQWNIYDFNKKIEEVKKSGDKQEDKDKKIKEINDSKTKEQEKLDFLNRVIKKEASLNYNSASFKSDYPKILLPLDNRKNEEQKKYYEAKKNVIDKYPSRREGEIAWELKRRQDYNQAATDEEAIDWMTSNAVSKEAFGQFTFKINSEYTYEQKWAKVKEGDEEHFIFPFLQKAYQKDTLLNDNVDLNEVSDTDLTTKVWFIGSESSNPEKILLDLDSESPLTESIIAKISQQKLLRVSHALLKVKQNENGAANDWSFDEDKDKKSDTLLHLLSFFGQKEDASYGQVYKQLLPVVFEDESKTKIFIDYFADDPSGRKIQGSLGVKTLLDYIKEMEPGFGLGVLSKVLNSQSASKNKKAADVTNYLTELSTNINDVAEKIWKETGLPTNQNEVVSKLQALSPEQKTLFANAFKKTFDPQSQGLNLVYPAGNNASIVFSKHGMHIIKTEDFSDINKLKSDIKNDLQTVANSQKEKDSKTKWGELFSKYFKENQRRQFIKNNFNQDDKLKNYIDEQEKKRTEAKQRIVWEEIVKTIDSLDTKQKISSVDDALGDKVKEFYIKGIDKGTLQEDSNLKPEEVKNKLLNYIIPTLTNKREGE